MPSRPNKKKGRKPAAGPITLVEEDDNVSVTSDQTTSTQQLSDEEGLSEEEKYEEKMREAIDLAMEKSVQTRTNALTSLKVAIQKKMVIPFLLDNYQTITDIVERSLKKGRGMEQIAASKLASVLIISLFNYDQGAEIYKELHNTLRALVSDPAVAANVRQEFAHTIAILAFLACPEPTDLPNTLNNLHNIFCGSLPKGNGELPSCPPAMVGLHIAALQGVCLLLTLLSNQTVHNMAPKLLEELVPVLASSDVDLRISVGEAIALVYELSREYNEDFKWLKDKENNLIATLSDLATDSHKYRGKKERKLQRASFREILKSVEDYDNPYETISVGPASHRQELELDSWTLRSHYQCVCHALDIGVNNHMTFNPGIRELFSLGPPPVIIPGNLVQKGPKKISHESPAVKARSLARSKNRDNRAADLCYDD